MIQTIPTLGEQNQRVFSSCYQDLCKRLRRWFDFNIYRISRWGVLQHFVELFRYLTKEVLVVKKNSPTGPNTLEELLQQFDLPKKEKTQEEIIRNYQVFLTLAALELDMLKMNPSIAFTGHQYWIEFNGTKFCDFVPCIIRPEVVYCCYGKN